MKYNIVTQKELSQAIFRAYDIRGVVGQGLNADVAYTLGLAIGTEANRMGQQGIIVGRDARLSGPELIEALIAGLMATGQAVIDIGVVPTPVLYFATHVLTTRSGIMLTGSHNPADYNGFKIVLDGKTLAEGQIQALYQRIIAQDFDSGAGVLAQVDIIPRYISQIVNDVTLKRSLKVVVDGGNGVAGRVAPQLLRELGCEVIELYCQLDGRFPNHHPDPSKPENVKDLIAKVAQEKADLGIAFDGDADRLGVVSGSGDMIWPDRQMILFAGDILQRHPKATILFDVKCSRHLPEFIQTQGGNAVMWKTGHSLIKRKMQEDGALLAGEMSGHIFFKERWFGFDDAIYSAARLLEILAQDSRTPTEVFNSLPDSVNTPELQIKVADEEKFAFVKQLVENAEFPDAQIHTIDGLRVDYQDGWGLVRASNTTPCLVLRFEANTEAALERIQQAFRVQLLSVNPGLEIGF